MKIISLIYKNLSKMEKIAFTIAIVILLSTVILPVIMAILWSLVSPNTAWAYPNIFPEKLDFGRWIYLWKFTSIKQALLNSYTLAPLVALLSILLALPSAYAIGRFDFRGKWIVQIIILIPLVMPALSVAIFFTQTLNIIGIKNPYIGITIGHTIIFLPYSLRLLSSAFYNIPQDQIDAARDLGANKLTVFMTAYMPTIRPAVFVAFIYIFVMSIGEFNISYVLGSPNYTTVPTVLFSFLGYNFIRPNAAVISLMLMIPNLIIMFSIEKALSAHKIIGSGLKG